MALASATRLVFLLALLVACHLQEYTRQVTVTLRARDCIGPRQCLTLTEYAQNSSIIHSQTKLVLDPGVHNLSSNFTVRNAFNFEITAGGGSIIDCGQNAAFTFENVTYLTVKNLHFVSCGEGNNPGVKVSDVSYLYLANVTFSSSTTGALYISNSHNLTLQDLSVLNNLDSASTIVQFENSEIKFIGTTTISNNSIKELNETCSSNLLKRPVFQIKGCRVILRNLLVNNNTSPHGVLRMIKSELINSSGSWKLEHNRVMLGGSLSLESTRARFVGNFLFTDNSVNCTTNISGMFIRNSSFDIEGDIMFLANKGYARLLQSNSSNIAILGSLTLFRGNQGILLGMNSALTIHGSLNIRENSFNLLYSALRIDSGSTLTVEGNTTVVNNSRAKSLVAFDGKIFLRGKVNFKNNVGVLYAHQSVVEISGISNFTDNSLNDAYLDGTLTLVRMSTLNLSGEYSFRQNQIANAKKNGGAIYASLECEINLSGTGLFTENSAKYGGAIYMEQKSRMKIKQGTTLVFHHNRAVKGGAIFISCSTTRANCLSVVNDTSGNVSLEFTSNVGDLGGSIIHANIDNIHTMQQGISNTFFTALDDLKKKIMIPNSIQLLNTEPKYSSDNFRFCFCSMQTEESCNPGTTRMNMSAVRGKEFSVSVRVHKLFGDITNEPVKGDLHSSKMFVGVVSVLYGHFLLVEGDNCTILNYTILSSESQDTLILNIGDSTSDGALYINVAFQEVCPIGFELRKDGKACICDHRIEGVLDVCDITKEKFKKNNANLNTWIGVIGYNTSYVNDSIMVYSNTSSIYSYTLCPTGYCVTTNEFSLSEGLQSICSNNRTGILCGICEEELSILLGGVKCDDCSEKNAHLALLIVFTALGIILVALIFLTQITVATGTINGLILYINIVSAKQHILLGSNFFKGYSVAFISWLNLDFGIEICFYDGMDQLQYAGWQFVFPVYLLSMVGVIIIACHYSIRISKLFGMSDPVAVLATIILLSYTSLAQNIIHIFSYAKIINAVDNSTEFLVWRYNGEINYATDGHAALFAVALVFFVCLFLPFTLVLISAQLLQRYNITSKVLQLLRLNPFIKVFHVPFKPAHRYWLGLCLLMRCMLLLIFTTVENHQEVLLAIVIFCILSLGMFGITGGVYESRWLNILEISFVLNLGLLSAARFYAPVSEDVASAYISVSVAFVTFVGIVVFHFYKLLKRKPKVKKAIENLKNKMKQMKKTRNATSANVVKRVDEDHRKPHTKLREPLLESQQINSH